MYDGLIPGADHRDWPRGRRSSGRDWPRGRRSSGRDWPRDRRSSSGLYQGRPSGYAAQLLFRRVVDGRVDDWVHHRIYDRVHHGMTTTGCWAWAAAAAGSGRRGSRHRMPVRAGLRPYGHRLGSRRRCRSGATGGVLRLTPPVRRNRLLPLRQLDGETKAQSQATELHKAMNFMGKPRWKNSTAALVNTCSRLTAPFHKG